MQKGLARAVFASILGVGIALGVSGTSHAAFPQVAPVVDVPPSAGLDAVPPVTSPVRSGTRVWTVPDYIRAWEKANGRRMTTSERNALARGCIGVTVVNMERGNINPPLGMSFDRFSQARAVAAALERALAGNPSVHEYRNRIASDPLLRRIKNVPRSFPYGLSAADIQPVIFSKRYYDGDPNKTPLVYRPDPVTGQVDMSQYRYEAKPGYVNFDYGWFDERTNNWWHANHAEPGMKIYQSTLAYYSRPLLDFDGQVFSVAFGLK